MAKISVQVQHFTAVLFHNSLPSVAGLYLLTSLPLPLLLLLLLLSLIPGWGDGSLPRSSPGSSIGILGCFDSGDLAMTPAAPGRVLCITTKVCIPLYHHHTRCSAVSSAPLQCGQVAESRRPMWSDRPPTMENGPCTAEPP